MSARRARDVELLDALDAHEGVSFQGDVWRIIREGRNVLQGAPSNARWDPGTFDVLYTSLEREGALEEINFHLCRQPVFPSKIIFVLHQITVCTRRTLRLADLATIAKLGVSRETFLSFDYSRTQAIADAADFLGFDGILGPSARWPCHNLVLFTDKFAPKDFVLSSQELVDWDLWRRQRGVRLSALTGT
jgi:RES domain-containing protein